ncbi:MAG TPA: MarR family winged helix-turn-helix transcriptional regulator [Acidimicrobiales bacterium]|nr:MarR family winged helix-turn-helix transcriptional regulator [Acidimicrobiales bacterium]
MPPIDNPTSPRGIASDEHMKIEAVRALARASRMLVERASSELSPAHYRVLSAVAAGDERASRVATRLAIGKPTISATVDALCQRGLLVRSEVAGDQRAAALALTPEGVALLSRVEHDMIERIDDLAARTPDAAQLLESLVQLGTAIDETQAERMAQRRKP